MKPLYLGLSFTFFFLSVMIVAREHSPVLISFGCVRRETKARSFFARNLTSFTRCYYVIGLFNRVQTNHKHKRKRMWFGCDIVIRGEWLGRPANFKGQGYCSILQRSRDRLRAKVFSRWRPESHSDHPLASF